MKIKEKNDCKEPNLSSGQVQSCQKENINSEIVSGDNKSAFLNNKKQLTEIENLKQQLKAIE
jgi:hypothetical protein